MRRQWLAWMLLAGLDAGAQTVVQSVADGDWTDPATWDCSCIPANIDSVIVSHQVGMSTDQVKTAGALRVGVGASLSGGPGVGFTCLAKVVNEGTMSFEDLRLKASAQDSTLNFGGIVCTDHFVLEGYFVNYGTVDSQDTLDAYIIFNKTGADLEADHLEPTTFWNLGTATCTTAYLLNLYNEGSFVVQDMVERLRVSGGGLEVMGNADVEDLYSLSAPVHVHGDATLYVADLEGPHLVVDGDVVITGWVDWETPTALMSVGGDLLNLGNMSGGPVEGAMVCVGGQIINQNYISGLLDICDLSPTAVAPPFIDVNVGVVEPNVTFCSAGTCAVGVKEQDTWADVIIAQDPTNTRITVSGLPADVRGWSLHDAMGRQVQRSSQGVTVRIDVELQGLGAGVYLLRICRDTGCRTFRVVRA